MLKTILLSSSCCNNAENKWANCHDNGRCWSSPSSNGDDGDAAAVATQHLSSLLKAPPPPPAAMVEAAVFTMTLLRRKKRQKEKERGKKKVPKFKFIWKRPHSQTGALVVGAGSQGPIFC